MIFTATDTCIPLGTLFRTLTLLIKVYLARWILIDGFDCLRSHVYALTPSDE